MDNKLNEAVTKLAGYRRSATEAKEQIKAIETEIAQSELGERLAMAQVASVAMGVAVEGVEAKIRSLSLDTYAEADEKHPHPAITIKSYAVLEYEPGLALEYARQHLPGALKLNKRTFEKAAKAIDIPGVEITQEPRATIARDLSEWLED